MASTDTEKLRPVELDPEPIDTSKAQRQPEGQFYDCDEAYAAQFATTHGYDLQHGYDIEFTSILRPDLAKLDATPGDEDSVQAALNKAARAQTAALAWAAGDLPWESFRSNLGGMASAKQLGCIDVSLIHDLGA